MERQNPPPLRSGVESLGPRRMSENEEVDNVHIPDAWRSLPGNDLLHASAHRAQLRRKRVVRFDPYWMRCHWPEELVPRHGTRSGCSHGK